MSRRSWFTVAALLFAVSCGGGDGGTGPSGFGTVTGKVVAADGTTPIALASVYAQSQGAGTSVLTDDAGEYTLTNVPSGSQTIVAEKGSFRATSTVNVSANGTVSAPAAKLAPVSKLGYVYGSFDSIQDIVTDLGYPIQEIAVDNLASATTLNQYSMIFLNCGAGVSTEAATVNALKAWVTAGGTLYASDWELDVIQAMFPSDVLEVGSGDEQSVTASVTNANLQQATGKSSVSIQYDLIAWKMLQSISSTPTVLLRGTVTGYDQETYTPQTFTNQPLAISWNLGQGKVVYTTFHNEAGATADQLAVLKYFIHY